MSTDRLANKESSQAIDVLAFDAHLTQVHEEIIEVVEWLPHGHTQVHATLFPQGPIENGPVDVEVARARQRVAERRDLHGERRAEIDLMLIAVEDAIFRAGEGHVFEDTSTR